MIKYDDAKWHSDGEFPEHLPESAGATHIAMFVTWCMLKGFASEIHTVDAPEELEDLKTRTKTPGQWFLWNCDGKFTMEDLTPEGNRFATRYYGSPSGGDVGYYLDDYVDAFPEAETVYSVEDSWLSFDALAPVIDRRFAEWREGRLSLKPK
jgi:hypothetical protein